MVSHQESPTVESKRNHYVDLCLERSCTRCDWWCRGDRHALSLSLFPWRLPNCLLIRWVMPGRRFVQIRAPLRLDVWSTRLTSQLCLQQHHDRLRAKLSRLATSGNVCAESFSTSHQPFLCHLREFWIFTVLGEVPVVSVCPPLWSRRHQCRVSTNTQGCLGTGEGWPKDVVGICMGGDWIFIFIRSHLVTVAWVTQSILLPNYTSGLKEGCLRETERVMFTVPSKTNWHINLIWIPQLLISMVKWSLRVSWPVWNQYHQPRLITCTEKCVSANLRQLLYVKRKKPLLE